MANKDFGVKKIELIGSSGTPKLSSPTNLNLDANTVAISTDVTIGGKVQSNVLVGSGYSVGIGSTLPQQAIDVDGTIRATSFVQADGNAIGGGGTTNVNTNSLNVSGVSTFGSTVNIGDATTLNIGDDNDLAIYETSGDVGIVQQTSGKTLFLRGDNVKIDKNGSKRLLATSAGALELYYNDSKKLETISTGVTVTGDFNVSSDGQINAATALIGANAAESDNTLINEEGIYAPNGIVTASSFSGSMTDAINLTGGGRCDAATLNITGIATIADGRIQAPASANLRFGNLAAGSGSNRNIAIGDQVLGSLSSGSGRNIGIGELALNSVTGGSYNIGLGIKAGQRITSGQYNVVIGGYDGNTDDLDIRTASNRVVISDNEGNIRQYIADDGKVGINTTVLTEMLTVSGVVSATSFYGTLLSSQLTGALPALDGSALTGVSAVGSGVEVKDDDSAIGAAATINFGSRLSVSAVSAGVVTITADAADIPGINTTGTSVFDVLDIGGAVTIDGLTKIGTAVTFNATSGIVSATEFYGDGSNLRDVAAASVYVDESEDDNQDYDVVFLDGTGGANASHVMQVDSGSFKYNPSTGRVTAASFGGSAAGLTNLQSSELSGALPAIDGSALLNVNASGEGVVVEDDDSNIGTAKTVNFGTGLDVQYDSNAGIATINASGGSLQTRTRVSGTTTSIANNGIGNTDITGFKSYALMKVGLSTAGWLRIYTDSASRSADASRSVGEDPAAGSGVIAEVVTTGISTQQNISPFTMGGNMDDPVDTTIYMAITNLSGSTQAIEANLTILQLEA
mgnify:CR=1 FL=1